MVMEWVGSSGSPGVDMAHSTRINSSATQTAARRIVRSAEEPVAARTEEKTRGPLKLMALLAMWPRNTDALEIARRQNA